MFGEFATQRVIAIQILVEDVKDAAVQFENKVPFQMRVLSCSS